MIDFIVDSNILIYCSQKQEKYVRFFQEYEHNKFGISSISVIELLVGAKTPLEFFSLSDYLQSFVVLPLDKTISIRVARTLLKRQQRSFQKSRIADICIAETALYFGVPLVTNNAKDFRVWKNLQTIIP